MRRINAKQEEKLSKGKVSNQLPKLNVDAAGIDVDRYRIRTKLGLNNQKTNLRSYLNSLI